MCGDFGFSHHSSCVSNPLNVGKLNRGNIIDYIFLVRERGRKREGGREGGREGVSGSVSE